MLRAWYLSYDVLEGAGAFRRQGPVEGSEVRGGVAWEEYGDSGPVFYLFGFCSHFAFQLLEVGLLSAIYPSSCSVPTQAPVAS